MGGDAGQSQSQTTSQIVESYNTITQKTWNTNIQDAFNRTTNISANTPVNSPQYSGNVNVSLSGGGSASGANLSIGTVDKRVWIFGGIAIAALIAFKLWGK